MAFILCFIAIIWMCYYVGVYLPTKEDYKKFVNNGNAVFTDNSDSDISSNSTTTSTNNTYIKTSISSSDYNRYDSNVNSIDMNECDDAIKSYSSNFFDNIFDTHKNDLAGNSNNFTDGIEDYVDRKRLDYDVTSKKNNSYWESKKLNKKDQWATKGKTKNINNGNKSNPIIALFIVFVFFMLWPVLLTFVGIAATFVIQIFSLF